MIAVSSALKPTAVATLLVAGLAAAHAQGRDQGASQDRGRLESLENDTSEFFGRIFSGSDRFNRKPAPVQTAQVSASELVVRLDRLENQVRQLTGMVEQLQYRNQQLEQQLRRGQEDGGDGRPPLRPQAAPPVLPQAAPSMPPVGSPPPPQRRADVFPGDDNPNTTAAARPPQRPPDVFNPNENPTAPGAPRVLGSLPSGPSIITGDSNGEEPVAPPVGAPGGRQAGAPLDLSTLSERAAHDPTLPPAGPPPAVNAPLPPPPPRNPSGTGVLQQHAMLPPTATVKEEYDLAYGYLLRKDYAQAEEGFRSFVRKYPSDRLTGEANYWLGESLFQRQRYRDAAEFFLNVSTKFEKSSKAPDALLRLGQSLAALKEKEAACATLVEVGRKYPRASPTVRQGVEREQKRAGC